MTATFRSDIEGLRAFAILPILFFHLDSHWLPSGFIGVDIFFVISGFLITRMIMAEGATFRFDRFYYGRFLRLYPALLMTIAGTLTVGWWVLSPDDYVNAAYSALSALVGVSNIYFYGSVDYFNDTELVHPLLHTWSLGVEEQFYLVWPLLLVFLVMRRGLPLVALTLTFCITTFVAAQIVLSRDPYLSFYMMPLRAFEFSLGAAALFIGGRNDPRSGVAFVSGLSGAGLLLAGLVMIDAETPWPGPWALAVAVGTAALIIGGVHPFWQRVFSQSPLRFLGRISYSLYLVHWPVIVLYRYWVVLPPSLTELIGLGAATVIFGTVLYYAVERPFRLGSTKMRETVLPHPTSAKPRWMQTLTADLFRWPAITTLTVTTLLSIAAITAMKGFPLRVERATAQFLDKGLTYAGDLCSYRRARCLFGDRSSESVVYVVGDSHALNLIYGLDLVFKEAGIKGIAFYDHGCLYLHDTVLFTRGVLDKRCNGNVRDAFSHLADTRAPVILAANWQGYRNQLAELRSPAPLKQEGPDYFAFVEERLAESLRHIGVPQRRVVLFKQTYSTGVDLRRCLARPRNGSEDEEVCPVSTLNKEIARTRDADGMIARVAARFSVVGTIDPKAIFCQEAPCRTRDGGELYFRDSEHLTNAGSEYLMRAARNQLFEALGLTPSQYVRSGA